jgi:AraC-like DNA-binding protein
MGRYLDYEAVAERAGISQEDLAALRRRVAGDYRSEILREAHLMRICRAVARGDCTVADALKPGPPKPPSISDLRMGG